MTPRMLKAVTAWGTLPTWVEAIVAACDMPDASQNKVAKTLGYSSAVVSQVLTKQYPGDLDRIEAEVRKKLMNAKLICPAIGEITEIACDHWRGEASELTSSSPMRVRMFRACNACTRFAGGEK